MTMSSALQELRASTSRLSEAVTELVMIAHEDRPEGSEPEPAAVDAFAEQVSELQASVALAHQELARIDGPLGAAERMAFVDGAIATASRRYWRLRSYDATATMRQAARRGGQDWRAWQVTVEQSQERCEKPLNDVTDGARAVWGELAQVTSLWLTHPPPHSITGSATSPATDPSPTTAADVPASENTWRST